MGAVLIEVVIVLAGVAIVILVAISTYSAWKAARAAAMKAPCALFTPSWPFPDECLGTCPVGRCMSTGKKRGYMIFWLQDTACGCPPVGGAPPAGPLMGPTTGIAPVDAQH